MDFECNFDFYSKCFKKPKQFWGHYIVLCGYDNRKGCILYRNPSSNDREFSQP